MVNCIEQELGNEWSISPAGGLTGDAYIATKDNQQLFLKRNSSPFLAVLSAEGIVPKLIWTKRLQNGDVITAQEWLEGRKLEPEEMKSPEVTRLLRRIHHSSELLHMLMRLGKKAESAEENYAHLKADLNKNKLITRYASIRFALAHLKRLLPVTRGQKQVVCHCDLNHNNLILTEDGIIYLIDWDNATIADPITDFGVVLNKYIPKSDWERWLNNYGIKKTKSLIQRMYWYLIVNTLDHMSWHALRNETYKVDEHLLELHALNDDVQSIILNGYFV